MIELNCLSDEWEDQAILTAASLQAAAWHGDKHVSALFIFFLHYFNLQKLSYKLHLKYKKINKGVFKFGSM